MRKPEEYVCQYERCFDKAEELVKAASKVNYKLPSDIFSFLQRHCYRMIPGESGERPLTGHWLFRQGRPTDHELARGIGTMMHMFGDPKPTLKNITIGENVGGGFYFSSEANILAVFDADRKSDLECAVIFLHEGYHALHEIGPKLEGLSPIDPVQYPDVHESNAWVLTFMLYDIGGGSEWKLAVNKEMKWIMEEFRKHPHRNPATLIIRDNSGIDWPELNKVFGPTTDPRVQMARRELLSLRANVEYWSIARKMRSGDVCHAMIKAKYARSKVR